MDSLYMQGDVVVSSQINYLLALWEKERAKITKNSGEALTWSGLLLITNPAIMTKAVAS